MTKIMKPIKFNNNDQLSTNALRPYKSKRKVECTIPIVSGSLPLASAVEQFIKEELPNADKPFHYHAEGAAAIIEFVQWMERREANDR